MNIRFWQAWRPAWPAWPRCTARSGLLLAGAIVLGATGCAPGSGDGAGTRAPARATIAFHYSHFTPGALTVRAGVPVTFTLRNDDPIDHEWIVGTPEVHAAHRVGTEPVHATRPTEVTVPALSTRTTTVTFAEPGDYAYICHLPGHEAYGMHGTLHVLPR